MQVFLFSHFCQNRLYCLVEIDYWLLRYHRYLNRSRTKKHQNIQHNKVKMSNIETPIKKKLPFWVQPKYYEDYLCFLIEEFRTQQSPKQFHFLIKNILQQTIICLNPEHRPNFHNAIIYIIQYISKVLNMKMTHKLFNDTDSAQFNPQFIKQLTSKILNKNQQTDNQSKNIRSLISVLYGNSLKFPKILEMINSLTQFVSISAKAFMMENWKIQLLCFTWLLKKKYSFNLKEELQQKLNEITKQQQQEVYNKIQEVFLMQELRQ